MLTSEMHACPHCGELMQTNECDWRECHACGLEGPGRVLGQLWDRYRQLSQLEDEVLRLQQREHGARSSGKVHLSHEDLRALQKVAADSLVGQLRRLETKWRELANSGWSEAGGIALCADDLCAVLDELEGP